MEEPYSSIYLEKSYVWRSFLSYRENKEGMEVLLCSLPAVLYLKVVCQNEQFSNKDSWEFQTFHVIYTILFSFETKNMYLSFNNLGNVHIIVFAWTNDYYTRRLTLNSISLFSKVYIFNFLFSVLFSYHLEICV